MAKSIFVSYNFNDREVSQAVKTMMSAQQNNIDGDIVFVENDVSYNGPTAVNWEIEHTMEDCDAALFVVGDSLLSSPWIDQEAQHAKSKDIPMMATCIPGNEEVVSANDMITDNCTMLGWNSTELGQRLNQC
jgi:hypothetical protein